MLEDRAPASLRGGRPQRLTVRPTDFAYSGSPVPSVVPVPVPVPVPISQSSGSEPSGHRPPWLISSHSPGSVAQQSKASVPSKQMSVPSGSSQERFSTNGHGCGDEHNPPKHSSPSSQPPASPSSALQGQEIAPASHSTHVLSEHAKPSLQVSSDVHVQSSVPTSQAGPVVVELGDSPSDEDDVEPIEVLLELDPDVPVPVAVGTLDVDEPSVSAGADPEPLSQLADRPKLIKAAATRGDRFERRRRFVSPIRPKTNSQVASPPGLE